MGTMARVLPIAVPMLAFGAAAAIADPIPLPKADFVASAQGQDSAEPLTVRHHDGVLRFEITMDGQSQVVLVDFAAQIATMLLDAQEKKIAVEMPAPQIVPEAGQDVDAAVIGSDTVAGEACEVWFRKDPDSGVASEICITADGIWLRVRRPGATEPNFEVVTLERAAQDAALFTVPEDYVRMTPEEASEVLGSGGQ